MLGVDLSDPFLCIVFGGVVLLLPFFQPVLDLAFSN